MNYQQTLHELLKYDVGRSAYFDVHILKNVINPVSAIGVTNNFTENKSLSYLCHSAELPGETLATVDAKIYGVTEKHPIMAAYNNLNLSFYTRGSDYEVVRLYFLQWLTTSTGRAGVLGNNNAELQTTYNVAYKKDIAGDIIINHYSVDGSLIVSCRLIDAFPIAISGSQLDWSMENGAMSLNVTFAYTEYEYVFYNTNFNRNTASIITPIAQVVNQNTQRLLQTNYGPISNFTYTPV